MSLFQSPPCLYPLTHENPSLQLTERTVPLVCSTPEKGEKEEMRRMGWVGGWGWKGNRLLALVGVGQPILLLLKSGRL